MGLFQNFLFSFLNSKKPVNWRNNVMRPVACSCCDQSNLKKTKYIQQKFPFPATSSTWRRQRRIYRGSVNLILFWHYPSNIFWNCTIWNINFQYKNDWYTLQKLKNQYLHLCTMKILKSPLYILLDTDVLRNGNSSCCNSLKCKSWHFITFFLWCGPPIALYKMRKKKCSIA